MAQIVQQFINSRHWETIPNGHGVKSAIIDAHTPTAVFFLYQEDRGGKGTPADLNEAGGEEVGHLFLNLGFLKIRVAIRTNINGLRVGS